METHNDPVRQLMDMLDNPKAYSEQDIHDIVNHDDDTREAYRRMAEAKRSSRWKQTNQPEDVDAAWQEFCQKQFAEQQPAHRWMKFLGGAKRQRRVAASFVGLLLVSGLAIAAIHIIRQHVGEEGQTPTRETQMANTHQQTSPVDTLKTETTVAVAPATATPVTFDDVSFDKMLTEMAEYYQKEVDFQSDEPRLLRFYFVWYKDQPIEKVIETLHRFEHVNIIMEDDKLIVR